MAKSLCNTITCGPFIVPSGYGPVIIPSGYGPVIVPSGAPLI